MLQSSLEKLHNNLCHPGISKVLHFMGAKNLQFLTTNVKRVVNSCPICAEIKPQFHCLVDFDQRYSAYPTPTYPGDSVSVARTQKM